MRALMAAVVGMGVLIVAGVAVIAVTIARRVAGGAAPTAAVTLDEPAGTHIAGLAPDGPDRLALRLEGGGPDRVVIIDLRSGRPAARVGLAR